MTVLAHKRRACPLILMTAILLLTWGSPAAASGDAQAAARLAAQGGTDGLRLVRSDAQGVVLELAAGGLSLASQGTGRAALTGPETDCLGVRMAGYATSAEAGRPALPVKVVLIGAPPGAEVEATAEPLATSRMHAPATICPVPTRTPRLSDEGRVLETTEAVVADAEVYSADAFYPPEVVRAVDLGFMRSQRIIRLEIYPLQYNPVSGEIRVNEQLRVALRFTGGTILGAPVAEPEEFENAYRRLLLNYEAASAWRGSPPAAAAAVPWVPPSPAYKVFVREEGLYRITRQELQDAGLPIGTVDPGTLKLYNGGQEIAIRVTGQADGQFDVGDLLLFYGQGVDTRYTDENVYWLTYGGAPGLRMADLASVAASRMAATFTARVRHEQNLAYISSLPKASGYDHWYGERLQVAGAGNKASRAFSLSLPRVALGGHIARLTAQLGGNYDGAHHVRLHVNGNQVYDGTWYGRTVHQAVASFTQGYLNAGTNTVTLELINDTPSQPADQIYVDWIEVEYERDYVTDDDRLAFGEPDSGTWLYQAAGFTSQDVEVYDVSDPAHVRRITGLTVGDPISPQRLLFLPLVMRGASGAQAALDGASQPAAVGAPKGPYAVRFGVSQDGAGRYLALTPANRKSVLRIEQDASSGNLSSTAKVDYLLITHAAFKDAIQPLASHRAAQGLAVKVVDVEEIYDQFGYGLMSAEAIRDFIAYAYAGYPQPAPSYVLLVGDGTYDFRGYTPYGTRTFIPPYLENVDPDQGETATDNRYVAVTPGDFLPDLHIGRLPANSAGEASNMVAKILAYEALAPADWMQRVLFVTDDLEGGGGNFYELSNATADGTAVYKGNTVKVLPEGYTADKVYLGQTCDLDNPAQSVECRAQIINRISAGSLLVSYIGHGTRVKWAQEGLFDEAALTEVNTGGRSPVMLPMTCNEGYFHDPDPAQTSLSEIGVRMPGNGPVASWAPTGFGLATGHDYLERGFFLALFYDRVSLGAAATLGKLYLVANVPPGQYADLIETFLLLGDPALKVPVQ